MSFAVSTPVYEGPFDLLLHLITKEQVDIYEVSLVRIVDAYLAEIEAMEALDLEVATEFLLIAATLVELKLRRLLPGRDDVDIDDELSLMSERDLLIAKLLEYQTFRAAAEQLRGFEAAASKTWPRTCGPEETFTDLAPDLLIATTVEDLRRAYAAVLRRALAPAPAAPTVSLDHVHARRTTVAEVIEELALVLPTMGPTTLRELTDGRARHDVVAFFLGLLELYKQGWVELDQTRNFGSLLIAWQPDGPEDEDLLRVGSSRLVVTVDAAEVVAESIADAMAEAPDGERTSGVAAIWPAGSDTSDEEPDDDDLAEFEAELDEIMAAVVRRDVDGRADAEAGHDETDEDVERGSAHE